MLPELDPYPFEKGYRAAVLQEDGKPLAAFGPTWPSRTEAMLYCFLLEGFLISSLSAIRSRGTA